MKTNSFFYSSRTRVAIISVICSVMQAGVLSTIGYASSRIYPNHMECQKLLVGRPVDFDYIDATLAEIIKNFPPHQLESYQELRKAIENTDEVEVKVGGMIGSSIGRVSKLELQNKQIVFTVDTLSGHKTTFEWRFQPEIKRVSIAAKKDALNELIRKMPSHQRDSLQQLVNAIEADGIVNVTMGGHAGVIRGKVNSIVISSENKIIFSIKLEASGPRDIDHFYQVEWRFQPKVRYTP